MKRIMLLVTVALVMAAMMVASGMPAFAQDPQGKVEQGPEHANSICSFSGLNDTPDEPAPEGGQVQSYGQLVQQDAAEPSAQPGPAEPGEFCNAHNAPLQEGSGPPE
jgi:hypothetical protein